MLVTNNWWEKYVLIFNQNAPCIVQLILVSFFFSFPQCNLYLSTTYLIHYISTPLPSQTVKIRELSFLVVVRAQPGRSTWWATSFVAAGFPSQIPKPSMAVETKDTAMPSHILPSREIHQEEHGEHAAIWHFSLLPPWYKTDLEWHGMDPSWRDIASPNCGWPPTVTRPRPWL